MRGVLKLRGLVVLCVIAAGCDPAMSPRHTQRSSSSNPSNTAVVNKSVSPEYQREVDAKYQKENRHATMTGVNLLKSIGIELDYDNWRIEENEAFPHTLASDSLDSCDIPGPVINSIHEGHDIRVLVNIDNNALNARNNTSLPKGTTLIIEHWQTETSPILNDIGIMIKRDHEYDPAYGNWEYIFVRSGNPNAILQGKLVNCRECHSKASLLDNVFLKNTVDGVLGLSFRMPR